MEHLSRPIVVFGRSQSGIAFSQNSTELVHLIFLLVTPADEQSLQVLLLGQIASIAGNADKRRRLREAASVEEVRQILTK